MMADEITNVEVGNHLSTQGSDDEVYGPEQRTWSNVSRGFAEDSQASDYVRHEARLADSRSRPRSSTAIDETGETV